MQTVFKVDVPKREQGRTFVPRREHQKSRQGCLACKRRRVKCDEGKPSCSKCRKTSVACSYAESTKGIVVATQSYLASPSMEMYSMGVELVQTDLESLLSVPSTSNVPFTVVSNVRMLQHFQTVTSLTLGGSEVQRVMNSFVAGKGWEHPYLMHMALAISTAHLKRLQPQQNRIYSEAESHHWQLGLQLYRAKLEDPAIDFDAAIATTFLTIMFTYALDDNIPVNAYSGNDEQIFGHALNPLVSTSGIRALQAVLGNFSDYLATSAWKKVLLATQEGHKLYTSKRPGIEGMPPAFVDLCELDENSSSENNQYHCIVRLLTPLLLAAPDINNFGKLFAFSGRTWPHFKPLILKKDPRALLLLSYWFALLRQVDQWWLTLRARTECKAIVIYLCQLEDAKISTLLPFPASFGQTSLSLLWEKTDHPA